MPVKVTKATGLYTSPNQLSEVPEGALAVADNVVIRQKGIIEPRRGRSTLTTTGLVGIPGSLVYYNNGLIVHSGTTIYSQSGGGVLSGSFSAAYFKMKFVEANQNLYLTTTVGTKVMTGLSTAPVLAGVPRALDPSIVAGAAGNAVGATAAVGFRVIWGIKDANNNIKLGAPSGRVVLSNATGAGVIATVTIPIPDGITTSHFYRVYQTVDSADENTDPGDECFQSYSAVSPGTSGTFSISVNQPQTLLGDPCPTNPNTGDGILSANEPPPKSNDLAFWNDRMWWANTTQKHRLSVEMLGVGAPNGVQENDTITIAGVAYRAKAAPAVPATDFLLTTGGTAAQNVEATTKSLINLINTSASNTLVYAYYASGENEATGKFLVEARTLGAASFTVAFSRAASWNAVSGTSDNSAAPNGLMYSKASEPEAAPLVNFLYVGGKNSPIYRILPLKENLFVFKGDGIYLVSGTAPYFRVSLLDDTTHLIAPDGAVNLNNQIYALTNQGVVSVTQSGVGVISRPIESALFAFTGTNSARAAFPISAWMASSESDRSLYLGIKTTAAASLVTFVFNAFTNTWTTWAGDLGHAFVDPYRDRLVLGSGTAALVYAESRVGGSFFDYCDSSIAVTVSSVTSQTVLVLVSAAGVAVGDVFYQSGEPSLITAVNGNTITLYTDADMVETRAPGPATIYKAFTSTVEWAAQFAGEPSHTKHFRDATLHFGKANFYSANATFRTEVSTAIVSAPITTTTYNCGAIPTEMTNIRTGVPKEKRRGTLCRPGFVISEAGAAWSLFGYSLEAEDTSERNSR